MSILTSSLSSSWSPSFTLFISYFSDPMLGSELKVNRDRDKVRQDREQQLYRTDSDEAVSEMINRDFNDNKSVGFGEVRNVDRISEQKDKDLYRLKMGLSKERERFKDLEEFCNKTLSENNRLLTQVLNSARESDLRPILQIQCSVIERLLSERAKGKGETKYKIMAEKCIQTEVPYDARQMQSPLGLKSQKYIQPAARSSLQPEMLIDSALPENKLLKLSVNDLNFDAQDTPGRRDDSQDGAQSYHFGKSVQDFDERKPVWEHHRHGLQREASQQIIRSQFPKRKESPPEDLLRGSPFEVSNNKLNEDNLLLFEDGSPIREFRKNKTEAQLPRLDSQPVAMFVEQSPAMLSRYLAKVKDDKDIEVASRDTRKGSFSELAEEHVDKYKTEDKLIRKRADSNISGYLEQMRMMKDSLANKNPTPHLQPKSAFNSPQKSNSLARKASQQIRVSISPEPVLPYPETEARVEEVEERLEKKSAFENMNFKEFLSGVNSPTYKDRQSPKLKAKYFSINPEEATKSVKESPRVRESPRMRDSMPEKANKKMRTTRETVNNTQILRSKDLKNSGMVHNPVKQKYVSRPKKVWETGMLSRDKKPRSEISSREKELEISKTVRYDKSSKLELLGDSLMEELPREYRTLLPASFKPYRETSERLPDAESRLKHKHFGRCLNIFK